MSNCKIVQDLLPLYVDEICSDESKEFVDSHISECSECTDYLNRLKNDVCVETVGTEAEEVVLHHAKAQNRVSTTVGLVFAGVLMIPIVVCMIVNLATGHSLDWFYIVLTSLMVFASVTVVPLVVYKNRFPWALAAFTGSLLLLFATICIFTHGRWFFIVAFSSLLGLAIPFLPLLTLYIREGFWSRNKALLTLGVETVLLFLSLLSISVKCDFAGFWRIAAPISIAGLLFAWVILFLAIYLKASAATRAGLIVLWIGFCFATAENIVVMILGYNVTWHAFHPLTWSFETIKGNAHWIGFILSAVIAVILFVIDILGKKEK